MKTPRVHHPTENPRCNEKNTAADFSPYSVQPERVEPCVADEELEADGLVANAGKVRLPFPGNLLIDIALLADPVPRSWLVRVVVPDGSAAGSLIARDGVPVGILDFDPDVTLGRRILPEELAVELLA